jgi:hypothetical protein
MLYLSLILIAAGLFFIFYTLLIKSKQENGTSYSKKVSGPVSPKKTADTISISELVEKGKDRSGRINISRKSASKPDILDQDVSRDDLFDDTGKGADNEVYDIEDKFEDEKMSESSPVVMYEDASNIIDYNNNDSIIDSTLKEYKKIKRVGAGNLEFSEDGIYFRTGTKLFRFDFRRITDIKSGNNFIVLMMKGNSVLKLFLFKKNTLLSEKLKQVYNKYSANVL